MEDAKETRMANEKERVDAYLDTVSRLEPNLHPIDRDGALASIAISLKRIADSLTAVNLDETVRTAVYNGTYDALHQHWRDKH
jgi:hypothetical protein